MHQRIGVAVAATSFLSVCCLVSGCSQGETSGSPSASGGPAGNAGSSGSAAGTAATPSAGSAPVSGSSPGGSDALGGGGGSAGSSSGGLTGSSGGGAGTPSSSGGLFGGNEGEFPTLELPVTLPTVAPAAPCPAGSVLQKVGSPALHSWPGTVFSSALLSGQGENHAPTKLQVKVTKPSRCREPARFRPGSRSLAARLPA